MRPPDSLYKYHPLSAYSLAGLVNGTIWLAKPSSFNDPFDCALTVARGKFDESLRQAVDDIVAKAGFQQEVIDDPYTVRPSDLKAFEEYRANILSLHQNSGICCFSAVPDSMLMWSHYADHHRGFCIEFDSGEGSPLRKLASPVIYSKALPSLSAVDLRGPNRQAALDSLWLTKSSCWEYEEEWRVIMSEGNKSYRAPSAVKAIIFGTRMPESERTMIAYAARNLGSVQLKEAVISESEFKIELVSGPNKPLHRTAGFAIRP